jgi:hypothetical protein
MKRFPTPALYYLVNSTNSAAPRYVTVPFSSYFLYPKSNIPRLFLLHTLNISLYPHTFSSYRTSNLRRLHRDLYWEVPASIPVPEVGYPT